MSVLASAMSVRMTLRHVLYVSYLLPAAQVRPVVPRVLPLAILGPDSVFISVVCLTCEGVRAAALPWPRFTYNQLNVRTYVIDPITDMNAVYFIRSGVTSRMTSALTGSIGLPWEHIDLRLEAGSDPDSEQADVTAVGRWDGDVRITAQASASVPASIYPFDRVESAIEHLTGPLIGFIGPENATKRFEIEHRALEVRGAGLREMRFDLLSTIGLVDKHQMEQPNNVLHVPEAAFTVCLPARRL